MELGTRVEIIKGPTFSNYSMLQFIGEIGTITGTVLFEGKVRYTLDTIGRRYMFSAGNLKIINPPVFWADIEEVCGWNPYKEKVT